MYVADISVGFTAKRFFANFTDHVVSSVRRRQVRQKRSDVKLRARGTGASFLLKGRLSAVVLMNENTSLFYLNNGQRILKFPLAFCGKQLCLLTCIVAEQHRLFPAVYFQHYWQR